MKKLRSLYVFVMVVFLFLGAVTFALASGKSNPSVLPPNSRVQGLTYGEWSARWWQYVLSIPSPQNPLTGGTGTNCVYQRNGNVGLIAVDPTVVEPIACEVPVGMMLFFDILSAECSNLEPDPFYGGNEEEMRTCAESFTITDLQATIDGSILQDLPRYVHTSPLFEFTLPEDNILGSEELTGQSVSNGAHLMLAPLSPGRHTIYLHSTIPELEFTVDMNFVLNVTK